MGNIEKNPRFGSLLLEKNAILVSLALGISTALSGCFSEEQKGFDQGFSKGKQSGIEVGIQAIENLSSIDNVEKYNIDSPFQKHPATYDWRDYHMGDLRREIAIDKARDKTLEGDDVPSINY